MFSPTLTMYCRHSVSDESTRSDTLSEMASGLRACFRNDVLRSWKIAQFFNQIEFDASMI